MFRDLSRALHHLAHAVDNLAAAGVDLADAIRTAVAPEPEQTMAERSAPPTFRLSVKDE